MFLSLTSCQVVLNDILRFLKTSCIALLPSEEELNKNALEVILDLVETFMAKAIRRTSNNCIKKKKKKNPGNLERV